MSIYCFASLLPFRIASITFWKDDRMINCLPQAILFDMDDTILAYSHNSEADRTASNAGSRFAAVLYILLPTAHQAGC